MVRALAGEITARLEAMGKTEKVRLFEINTENLIKKGIGYYLELAKHFAPCILFLDELDLLRLQRDGDSKLLSEFLTAMSGGLKNEEKDHVIIIAATNKPENLDFALRQHGRFGKIYWFDNPGFVDRLEFFTVECQKRFMDTNKFDLNAIARETEGCSYGTLDIVMKQTLMIAKSEGAAVGQRHFDAALDSEVKQIRTEDSELSVTIEETIAAHQAGKALLSTILKPAKELCKVTILPITQHIQEEHVTQQYNIPGMPKKDQRVICHGGIFSYHLHDTLNLDPQAEMIHECKILLAGNIAQRVYGLSSISYDKFDKQAAFELAKKIVLEGLDVKEMSDSIKEEKLTQAFRLIEAYEKEIDGILTRHKDALTRIVVLLQKHKTITAQAVHEAISNSK